MSVKTTAQNHKWWIKDGKIGLAKGSNDTATDYISPSAVHTVRYHYIKRDEDFGEDNGVFSFLAQATPGDWGIPTQAQRTDVAPYTTSGTGTGLICSYTIGSSNPTFTITTSGQGYKRGDTVGFKDPTSDGTAITLTIERLTIPYGKIGLTESPNIPEEFHEVLTHYAIARGYEKRPDMINNAIYFRNLWQQELNKAKKEADINKDGTPYFIQGYDF
tara:strand:- start:70 stop:720 length:651 start_codon:yes stop_codon:yes gene_type:complete